MRVMFGDSRAAPAILTFLRDTRVGRMASLAPRGVEEEDSESEGGEGRARPRMHLFLLSFLVLSFLWCAISSAEIGGRRDGDPTMTGSIGLRSWKNGYVKKPPPLPWPYWPHVVG